MIGKTLAHYEITGLLGKGGMGEVYRALDSKLGREVALKLLPPEVASDPERLARFRREARTLASLNHRRIASLFGIEEIDGMTILVMELVEGQDLAERLQSGALPVKEAIRICRQIAGGLESAHEIGVVHRDLKPANVKITPAGEIKILDFGLARAYTGESSEEEDYSASPTITAGLTKMGVILGTAAYMSPEQAKGKPVDRRTDIWAFGVILFELMTGQQLFQGETASETMADVMKGEIQWSRIPDSTPTHVRALLERCLDRDPVTRLRDIGEARIALDREGSDRPARPTETTSFPRSTLLSYIIALVALGIAAFALLWPGEKDEPGPTQGLRFRLANESTANLRQGDGRAIAISPDGMQVVTHGTDDDRTLLFTRRLDSFDWQPLPGTEGASDPTFSPDGRWIAFNSIGEIKKISVAGGAPVTIAATPSSETGGTWSEDGFIYYIADGGVWKVPDSGGENLQVLKADTDDLPPLRNPEAIPGRQALLLNSYAARGLSSHLYVLDLTTNELRDLKTLGSNPLYMEPGIVLFAQGTQVMAARFDPDALEITSAPIPVLQRAWIETNPQTMHLMVSRNGTAAYLPALPDARPSILLVDRTGTEHNLLTSPLPFTTCSDPRISPDGKRLALSADGFQIWILDLDSETPTLVSENGFYPVWSPDGSHLIFGSTRNRSYDLFRIPADLSQPEELILDWDNNLRSAAMAPDGTLIFREEIPGKGMDLFAWPVEDEASITPLLEGPDDELAPAISPDGKWMAYVSDLSSSDEIYVTSFPKPGARIQISANGGTSPAWSPDGKELYFQDGNVIMAARIDDSNGLRVISRETLFPGSYLQYRWFRQYDLSVDGKYFIMIQNPQRGDVEVIKGWAAELERELAAED